MLIAEDNAAKWRVKGHSFDTKPDINEMKKLLPAGGGSGGDDGEAPTLLFWTDDQTEDSGEPAGTRNGCSCDFKKPNWHYGDDMKPFHCTCPGDDPKPAVCEAMLGV